MLRARFEMDDICPRPLRDPISFGVRQAATVFGTWTGTTAQTRDSQICAVGFDHHGADEDELSCNSMRWPAERVGSANGYVFFLETITRAETVAARIDGAVTVAPAGTNLAWGWVGSYGGKVYVAWSNLVRK